MPLRTFFFNTTSSFPVRRDPSVTSRRPFRRCEAPRTGGEGRADGGRTRLLLTLEGGWSDSGDAMGAVPVCRSRRTTGLLFPFGKDEKAGVTALFALMEKRGCWKRCSLQECRMIFRATATIPQWTHSGEKSPEAMRSSMISAPGRENVRSCSAGASLRSVRTFCERNDTDGAVGLLILLF